MALKDNLISYWKLDEASGTRNDSHGSNHLTSNNSVGSTTGKINNGANFVRTNSNYLSVADFHNWASGSFTFSAWINFTSSSGTCPIISSAGGGVGSFNLYYYNVGGVDQFTWSVYFNNTITLNGVVSTGTWMFFVGWYDSGLDQSGIAVNAGTATTQARTGFSPYDNNYEFRLGNDNNDYFDGVIDEVGVWDRVLTGAERTSLYNGGSGLSYDSFGGGGGGSLKFRRGSGFKTGIRQPIKNNNVF